MRQMSLMNAPRSVVLCVTLICLVGLSLSCGSRSESAAPDTPPANAAFDPNVLTQADQFYAQRANLDRAREGLMWLRKARAEHPDNYEVAWRTARMAYTLGDHLTDENEKIAVFKEGVQAGEAAIKIEPNKPEGHFWLGADDGGLAEAQGPLSGLAAAKDVRREMETVLKLDEGYQGGSAYMALGQLDLELPGLAGGDAQRAVETLEKGLKYGSNNSLLRLQLAQAYLAVKRPDDARRQLDYILSMKPDPDYLPEYKENAEEARKILERRF